MQEGGCGPTHACGLRAHVHDEDCQGVVGYVGWWATGAAAHHHGQRHHGLYGKAEALEHVVRRVARAQVVAQLHLPRAGCSGSKADGQLVLPRKGARKGKVNHAGPPLVRGHQRAGRVKPQKLVLPRTVWRPGLTHDLRGARGRGKEHNFVKGGGEGGKWRRAGG